MSRRRTTCRNGAVSTSSSWTLSETFIISSQTLSSTSWMMINAGANKFICWQNQECSRFNTSSPSTRIHWDHTTVHGILRGYFLWGSRVPNTKSKIVTGTTAASTDYLLCFSSSNRNEEMKLETIWSLCYIVSPINAKVFLLLSYIFRGKPFLKVACSASPRTPKLPTSGRQPTQCILINAICFNVDVGKMNIFHC